MVAKIEFNPSKKKGDLLKLLPQRYQATAKTKALILKTLQRLNDGLLVYEVCSTEDLRSFVKSRQLEMGPTRARQKMIQALEDADQNARFEQFLDLPPEMRLRVYDFYFGSFEEHQPEKDTYDGWAWNYPDRVDEMPPPDHFDEAHSLTRTCRLIRKESVPVLYNRCWYKLHLSTTTLWYKREIQRNEPTRCYGRPIVPEHSRHLRKLCVDARLGDIGQHCSIMARVELDAEGKGFTVEIDEQTRQQPTIDGEVSLQRFKDLLTSTVDEILKNPKDGRWQSQHFRQISDAFDKCLRPVGVTYHAFAGLDAV